MTSKKVIEHLKTSKIELLIHRRNILSQKIDKDIYNAKQYQDKFDKSSKDELSFFDDLHKNIEHKINSNRQITINNLKDISESLTDIRKRAQELTESIINHDEHMIVEKQKIISDGLRKIHNNHYEVFQFEIDDLEERVFSIEYLHNQLVESNMEYFTSYKHFLSGTIENVQSNHDYLRQKSETINYTIEKHFTEIIEEFSALDQKIASIDEDIKKLITTKTFKEEILDEFFDIEIKNLTESQINFSINEDPYSENIKQLTEEKQKQFTRYQSFLHKQEKRLIDNYTSEVEEAYNHYYHIKYKKTNDQSQAEKFGKRKVKTLIKDKKSIIKDFKINNELSIMEMKKSLDLYMNFYKTDPFLAQLFYDNGSRIVTKEVDFTRLYKMNKALKYHIYFTYKLAQLNHEIKMNEHQFVHFIENKFVTQIIDIINIVKDIKTFLLDNQSSIDATQIALKRDKKYILFLNDLMNAHIDYQMKKENLSRTFLSEFTQLINHDVHDLVSMDINLLNSTSDILLALKESEIDTIHFKHMYQNEKRMLLIQQNRILSETQINHDLIASTYLNQMRFAKEQIKLAEEDLKLRLTALMHNVDSERIHYYEMINHEVSLKEEASMSEFSKYQKRVYDIVSEIEKTDDKGLKKLLEDTLTEVKKEYRAHVDEILRKYRNNEKIMLYQKRLDELDMYLEDAYYSASKLYDATIEEMDEIYRYAEIKYNEFVDNVDEDAYPLDDLLYESLQESKNRLNEKMLYAEITLDEKVKDKIEAYKDLYFKSQLKFDSKNILKLLDTYQDDVQGLEDEYHNTLDKINQDYVYVTESYNHTIRGIQSRYQLLIDETIKEKNAFIKEKTSEINQRDLHFSEFIDKANKKHQFDLVMLIEDYLDNLDHNNELNQELDNDYKSLIKSFDEYISYSKKSKNIRKLIKQTLKNHEKEKKASIKALKASTKKISLI